MKCIVFSIAVFCAFAAQAYKWNLKTGGELSNMDNWDGSGPNYEINRKQSAPLKCAKGTYTLLKGVNATADWITTAVEPFDTTQIRKVKVLKAKDANDVEVLQIKVLRKKGLSILVR